MEFNDLSFLLLFLPVFIIVFYLTKRNRITLLVFSFLFYLLSDIRYFLLLIAVIGLTYLFGLKVKGNKPVFVLYVILSIGLLLFFKYINLILNLLKAESIIQFMLPVGISYYLFESFSYASDCYYDKYEPEKNLFHIALYISFFPTIVSGPIIRYDHFHEFIENRLEMDFTGMRRFFLGLGKKIIIANQLVFIVNAAFADGARLSVPLAWAGLVAFALRLYYDFAGCSDMAIGIGQMIGYKMPENFNDPYTSLSVSEFFRRWHISLGSWFRDYIYIPLGGNRVGEVRWMLNIMTVWLFTGVWHGAALNYIVWGLFLGTVIILEKKFISKWNLSRVIRWIYTTGAILLSWLIFNTSSLHQFLHYAKRLLLSETFSFSYIKSLGILYIWPIAIIALLLMIPSVNKMLTKIKEKSPLFMDCMILVIACISFVLLISSSQATSVYFGF